jgi:hypothetical protein
VKEVRPLDFSTLPFFSFHLFLASLLVPIALLVYFYFPGIWLGFLWSLGFQFLVFEFWFFGFRIFSSRQIGVSIGGILLSFLGNAIILWNNFSSQGSNFIQGFFLAYFAFLSILVLSAFLTKILGRNTI